MSAHAWFEKFAAFGRKPSPESYGCLFHPEGSVEDAGMSMPTHARDTGAAIALVLSKLPDLHIDMARYRAHGDTIFVDAHNKGTLADQKLAWRAVYRVHLRDGLVWRGRRYYDQAELLRPLLAGKPSLPTFTPPEGGETPKHSTSRNFDIEHYCRMLSARDCEGLASMFARRGELAVPAEPRRLGREDIGAWLAFFDRLLNVERIEILDHVGDETLAFVEWRLTGTYGGQPLQLDGVDMLDLSDQHITSARRNFDTLSLLARTDPGIAAIRASVIAGAR